MSQPQPPARPPTGGSGFSLTNLKLMRQFYLQNAARIGQTLSDLSLPTAMGQTASDPLGAFRLSWSDCVFCWASRTPASAASTKSSRLMQRALRSCR